MCEGAATRRNGQDREIYRDEEHPPRVANVGVEDWHEDYGVCGVSFSIDLHGTLSKCAIGTHALRSLHINVIMAGVARATTLAQK